ncbi:MAG: hypothetical protein AB8C95_11190 [Phycisphaeraceae bacterium]
MPIFTILFGVALMAVGVGTYVGAGEGASLSAFLLQMILGMLAIGMGVGSLVKKELRMHLIHGAVLLACLGVIVPTIKFGLHLFELERSVQMNLLRALLTVAFSGAYVYAAVQSFRAARRSRTDATEAESNTPEIEADSTPAE